MHWHLILHWSGVDSASGTAYLAWSGVLSDLGELTLLGGLAVIVRRHNCEVKGCWRLGRHQTAANHAVCRRHHPGDHLTAGDIHAAHHAVKGAGHVRED